MQEPLAHGVDVLDRYLVYLLLGLVVQIHPLLGARHVVREVIVVQVLPGKQIITVRPCIGLLISFEQVYLMSSSLSSKSLDCQR